MTLHNVDINAAINANMQPNPKKGLTSRESHASAWNACSFCKRSPNLIGPERISAQKAASSFFLRINHTYQPVNVSKSVQSNNARISNLAGKYLQQVTKRTIIVTPAHSHVLISLKYRL
jgi:hypothetical protein